VAAHGGRAAGREHPAYLCAHILGGMNMKSADLPHSDISHILEERGKLFEKIKKYNREQEKSVKIAISPDHWLVVDWWHRVAKEEEKFPKEFMQFISLWEALTL
jgi:hypothetical protein